MTQTLEDCPVLVTGGGSGIGLAIAKTLAGAGAAVAISGRRKETLTAAVKALEAAGGKALAVSGDVTDPEDAQRMVDATVDAFGGLQVLVNNAGIARGGSLADATPELVHAVIDIDLKGPIFVTRAALPHLREHKDGDGAAVINISSSVTFSATPNFSVYSAAKAGLEMLTRCWALDHAPDRIRCNAISPGVVETPIFETMMPAAAAARALDQFAKATPLGRVGQPTDIAELALFLADPRSHWMTGAIIPLDGGLSLA